MPGAFSGSTGAPQAHDGLQHTPRHHIKPREPTSVPKVTFLLFLHHPDAMQRAWHRLNTAVAQGDSEG